MQLEPLRLQVIGTADYAESYRRHIHRMSNETVTDRRISLLRGLLQDGDGLDQIEAEPESPPPNSRVQAALSKSIEWLIEEDFPENVKALRIGAMVRMPWMDAETLRAVRDDVPASLWAMAARAHEFGDTRQERERFLEVLSDSSALELKIMGIPAGVLETWNYHYLNKRAVHLLESVGPNARWNNLDRLVSLYGPDSNADLIQWMEENGAPAGALIIHLLDTDQASITSPDKLEDMLRHCPDDDSLFEAIERCDAIDPTVVPACVRRWHGDVAYRRDMGSRIDKQMAGGH